MTPWKVGDRVVWPHQEGSGIWRCTPRSAGTVTAVDPPGLPPGVQVTFDGPVQGASTCYATYEDADADLGDRGYRRVEDWYYEGRGIFSACGESTS